MSRANLKEDKKAERVAGNLPEQLEKLPLIRYLEAKRVGAWRSYDHASREVNRPKDVLLGEIIKRLEQRMNESCLFTLRWRLVWSSQVDSRLHFSEE